MSDVELVIELAGRIERALVERGATGGGLREKAGCFDHHLSDNVLDAVAWIASERNPIAHGQRKLLTDRDGFVKACRRVEKAILAMPATAVARRTVEPWTRSGGGRSFGRRRRSNSLAGFFAGVAALGLIALFGFASILSRKPPRAIEPAITPLAAPEPAAVAPEPPPSAPATKRRRRVKLAKPVASAAASSAELVPALAVPATPSSAPTEPSSAELGTTESVFRARDGESPAAIRNAQPANYPTK